MKQSFLWEKEERQQLRVFVRGVVSYIIPGKRISQVISVLSNVLEPLVVREQKERGQMLLVKDVELFLDQFLKHYRDFVAESVIGKIVLNISLLKVTFWFITKSIQHDPTAKYLNIGLLWSRILVENSKNMKQYIISTMTKQITELKIFSFDLASMVRAHKLNAVIVARQILFLQQYSQRRINLHG